MQFGGTLPEGAFGGGDHPREIAKNQTKKTITRVQTESRHAGSTGRACFEDTTAKDMWTPITSKPFMLEVTK